jgi:hypothetical protein
MPPAVFIIEPGDSYRGRGHRARPHDAEFECYRYQCHWSWLEGLPLVYQARPGLQGVSQQHAGHSMNLCDIKRLLEGEARALLTVGSFHVASRFAVAWPFLPTLLLNDDMLVRGKPDASCYASPSILTLSCQAITTSWRLFGSEYRRVPL